jgi:IclR family transcriptional regulator, KDG regulon repressor
VKVSAKRSYSINSVQRCLRLLHLFAQSSEGLLATEVAALSGLPISTVYRFIANLEAAGFLNGGSKGKYHLDIGCFSVGHAALLQLDIRRISLPYLQALHRHTRETVHLTVRHGLSAVYVEKLDALDPPATVSRIGASVPLHCTAVGKVLLAYMPSAEQAEVLLHIDPRWHTRHTIGSVPELHRQLQKIRKAGYSFDMEEHELSVRCVAAPVWDEAGAVNASVSVSGPARRMPVNRLRELAPVIQEAGVRISRELGYQGPTDAVEYVPETKPAGGGHYYAKRVAQTQLQGPPAA